MSTWAIGLNTKNPGLQLMGLNKARENPKTESYVSKRRIETYAYGNKIIFSFKPIIHLADGIKLKKNTQNIPYSKGYFQN